MINNDLERRSIAFVVPGEIRGQGRPRSRIVSDKHGRSYTHIYEDSKDTANKHNIQAYAQLAMREKGYKTLANPSDTGIMVEIGCYLRVPKSTSKKKKEMAYRGEINPRKKPDLDNVAKAVLDAMNQVVFEDDKDVTSLHINRNYSDRDWLSIRVTWTEVGRSE